jgi:hypothetical protein
LLRSRHWLRSVTIGASRGLYAWLAVLALLDRGWSQRMLQSAAGRAAQFRAGLRGRPKIN